MKYRVDIGDPAARVALGVCDECGDARFLAVSYESALVLLAAHELEVHPDTKHVRSNLARYRAAHRQGAAAA
ncbi:hypothetical protein [Micropruina sp.]|uniref:hypothetical protein n=1 Tax=Micropruina sp. TaxID=2737536 RepID=UPI0039E70760